MKIIFLTSSPLHKMHFNDLYIDRLGEYFEYEIWDVSDLYGRGKDNKEFPQGERIYNLKQLETKISFLEKKTAVITNILIYDLYLVKFLFEQKKIPVISIDKELIFFWLRDNFLKQNIKYATNDDKKKFFWKSISFTRKIYSYLEYRHVKFDYILGAYNYYPDASKKFIRIHNLKYDECVNDSNINRVLDYKYILFIDGGLAHLPALSNKSNSISREDYIKHMNKLFDDLEEKYGLPIVIATHPKSEYQGYEFNGRKMILYKTMELSKHAEFVLAHFSTSLIDTIMQRKPIVFLICEDYLESCARMVLMTTMQYSTLIDVPLLDIKKYNLDELKINVNVNAYDSFISMHIRNDEKRYTDNTQLLVEFLNKI